MFKRLKEKIEEVKQTPIRFPPFPAQGESGDTHDSSSANDLINFGETNGPSLQTEPGSTQGGHVSHATPDQFSIADEDDASSSPNTPQRNKDADFEEVSISDEPERAKTPKSRNSDAAILPMYHSPDRPQYVPQSDIESEVEDPNHGINLEGVSKEQLFAAFQKTRARVQKYKAKYSEVVKAYKEVDAEKDKIKRILTDSQDKALRRIEELREQSSLEQQAKAHLEENLRCMLEEKEEMIKVLHTKVNLLKTGVSPEATQSTPDLIHEGSPSPPSAEDEDNAVYKEKVKRLETLLAKCKDTIKSGRERSTLLAQEKEALTKALEGKENELQQVQEKEAEEQAVLREKLQTLRKEAERARAQQEEVAMAMAETKRNIHQELELKEQQLAEVQEQLQTAHAASEALQAQLEESRITLEAKEKEHAESRHGLEQQLASLERTLEEERKTSLQELSRGKAAALNLMKQECEKKIQAAEHNWVQKLEASEKEYHRRISEKENELYKVAKKLSELKSITEESEDLVADDKEQQSAMPNFEAQRDTLLSDIELYKNVKAKLEQTVKELKDELQNAKDSFEKEKKELLQKHEKEVGLSRLELEEASKKQLQQGEEISNLREELNRIKEEHAKETEELRRKLEYQNDSTVASLIEKHAQELSQVEALWAEKLASEVSGVNRKFEETLRVNTTLEQSVVALKSELEQKERLHSNGIEQLKLDYSSERSIAEIQMKAAHEEEVQRLKSQWDKDYTAQIEDLKKANEIALKGSESTGEKLSQLVAVHESSMKEKLEEIATLRRSNVELVAQLKELQNEANEYKMSIQTVRDQCHHLAAELEEFRSSDSNRLAVLTDEKDSLQNNLGELQTKLQDSQLKVVNLERKLESAEFLCDQRKQALEKTQEEVQDIKRSLNRERSNFEEQIQLLRHKLDNTTASLSKEREKSLRLDEELMVAKSEKESLSEEKNSFSQRCAELSEKLSAQMQSLAHSEEEVSTLSSKCGHLQNEIKFLREEERKLTEQIAFLEGCQEALKSEVKQERSEKEGLKVSMQNDKDELQRLHCETETELREEIRQLKEHVLFLENQCDDLTGSHTLLQCQYKELMAASKVERENFREIHSQLEATQTERDSLSSRVEYLTESEQGLSQRNAALEKEVQILTATLEDLKMSLVRLEDERNGLAAELDVMKAQLRTLRISHEDQLQNGLKERETFQKALGDLESQYNSMVEERKMVEKEVDDLRSRDEDAKRLARENERLLGRLEEMEKENKAFLSAANSTAAEDRTKLLEQQLAQKCEEASIHSERLAELQSSYEAEVDMLNRKMKGGREQYESQIAEAKAGFEGKLLETAKQHQDEKSALQAQWKLECKQHISHIEQLEEELRLRTGQLDESLIVAEERAAVAARELQEALQRATELEEKHSVVQHSASVQTEPTLANNEPSEKVTELEEELSRQAARAEEKIRELEATIAEKEALFRSQVKDVAHSFSSHMEVQEAEHNQSISEAIDKAQQIETRLLVEHRQEIEALEQELAEKVNALEEVHEHYQELLKQKDEEVRRLLKETKHSAQPTVHSGWDDEWPKIDEEEWSASSAEHSPEHKTHAKDVKGPDKNGVYLQQIETLKAAIGKYQDEISDLRCILGSRQNNNASPSGKNCVRLPEPTEYEYLRNILFEYMMGKETVTLSKVIAAVLKFSDEQTNQILQREAAKQVQIKS